MQGHSMKMMWGCVALIALAAVLAVMGVGVAALLVIPCMLMMGVMMWMMMGDRGGRSRDDGTS